MSEPPTPIQANPPPADAADSSRSPPEVAHPHPYGADSNQPPQTESPSPPISDEAQKKLEQRIEVIGRVVLEKLPQKAAALLLNTSLRQVQRLAKNYKLHGPQGLIHGLTGKPSNNSRLLAAKKEAVEIVRTHYPGAGPTLAAEMLRDRHGFFASKETVRKMLTENDLWEPGGNGQKIRRRRQRKYAFGEMVQIDTSVHHWLLRSPDLMLYLHVAKDDATGCVFAWFFKTDSSETNLEFINLYIQKYGRPAAFYTDRASHFVVNPAKSSKMDDNEPETQIQRALRELDIQLILARSAPSKGRVEREHRTLQDRLVKLMDWDNVTTIEEANAYLQEFLVKHNAKFMKTPAYSFDLHRPKAGFDLDAILSVQESRKVSPDNVVRYDNKFYQLLIGDNGMTLRGKTVIVERRTNGTVKIRCAGKYYNYAILNAKKV